MNLDFLGTALEYPIRVDQFGRAATVSGKKLLEQSITSILNTEKETRFFLREFGSRNSEVLFEPNDDIVKNLLRTFINEALQEWEKRIKFVDVDFTFPSPSTVNCEIYYKILQSNEIDSFVYPFYKELKY